MTFNIVWSNVVNEIIGVVGAAVILVLVVLVFFVITLPFTWKTIKWIVYGFGGPTSMGGQQRKQLRVDNRMRFNRGVVRDAVRRGKHT